MYSEEHRQQKQREATRRYRERHAKELKVECDRIRQTGEKREYWREKTKRNREKNREAQRALDRKYYSSARAAALSLLGNKCKHCGFNDTRLLQLDHINAIGDAERKRLNHYGRKLYRIALKTPELFQLLCPNCNWKKRLDNNEGNQRKSKSSQESAQAGG